MDQAKFKPGDIVIVVSEESATGRDSYHSTKWNVVEEDTNKTPVRDHEPAYKLERLQSLSKRVVRYCYQSNMRLLSPVILRGNGG